MTLEEKQVKDRQHLERLLSRLDSRSMCLRELTEALSDFKTFYFDPSEHIKEALRHYLSREVSQ